MIPAIEPHHIRIGRDEVAGNGGRGRFFLLPGSEARARRIAEHFRDVRVYESPRQINAYLGTWGEGEETVDLAAVPTGMGCPSVGIVLMELLALGARRFVRVGSSGSLQPQAVRVGDLVVATAAVRDEAASDAYCPRDIPAVAHPDWVRALSGAARRLGHGPRTFAGLVHAKDSLYGRELPMGPRAEQNRAYMATLRQLGVIATEMESSHLFILASTFNADVSPVTTCSARPEAVKAGTILAIIGDEGAFADPAEARVAEERAVDVALAACLDLRRAEDAGAA